MGEAFIISSSQPDAPSTMSTMFAIWMPPPHITLWKTRYATAAIPPVASVPSQITWSGVMTGTSTWVKADQYIQLTVNADTTIWGIQIYTDNTAPDANPVFTTTVNTGNPGSNPAGPREYGSSRSDCSSGLVHPCRHDQSVANAGTLRRIRSGLYPRPQNTLHSPADTTAFSPGQIYSKVITNQGIQYTPSSTASFPLPIPRPPSIWKATSRRLLGGHYRQVHCALSISTPERASRVDNKTF